MTKSIDGVHRSSQETDRIGHEQEAQEQVLVGSSLELVGDRSEVVDKEQHGECDERTPRAPDPPEALAEELDEAQDGDREHKDRIDLEDDGRRAEVVHGREDALPHEADRHRPAERKVSRHEAHATAAARSPQLQRHNVHHEHEADDQVANVAKDVVPCHDLERALALAERVRPHAELVEEAEVAVARVEHVHLLRNDLQRRDAKEHAEQHRVANVVSIAPHVAQAIALERRQPRLVLFDRLDVAADRVLERMINVVLELGTLL